MDVEDYTGPSLVQLKGQKDKNLGDDWFDEYENMVKKNN